MKPVKIVIDASIGFKTILVEDGSEKALKLRDDFKKGIHELLAPDLYAVELSNAIVVAARKGEIAQADLPIVYADLMANLPYTYMVLSLLPRAYSIASQVRVSIYDAIYLSLSDQEGCPLLTDDQKLIKAAPGFSFLTRGDL